MPRTTTDALNTLIARHLSGDTATALRVIEGAFGTGGVDALGNPLPAERTRTALRTEIHRNTNVTVTRAGAVATALVVVNGDVTGPAAISEVGIFAAGGNLLAYATFAARQIAPGTQLNFRFRI